LLPQQTKPWLGIDLGQKMEVKSVTVIAAPAGTAGFPTYTSAFTFTVRVGNVAPHLGTSPSTSNAVCRNAVPGPLSTSASGTTWLCATAAGISTPKSGRYLTIELNFASKSRLALAEVFIEARPAVPAKKRGLF
jgi:hypothetical protein